MAGGAGCSGRGLHPAPAACALQPPGAPSAGAPGRARGAAGRAPSVGRRHEQRCRTWRRRAAHALAGQRRPRLHAARRPPAPAAHRSRPPPAAHRRPLIQRPRRPPRRTRRGALAEFRGFGAVRTPRGSRLASSGSSVLRARSSFASPAGAPLKIWLDSFAEGLGMY